MLLSSDPKAGSPDDSAPPARDPQHDEQHGSPSMSPAAPADGPTHQRTASTASSAPRDHSPPYFRSSSTETHAAQALARRRCSDATPPAIRYSHSETPGGLRRGPIGEGGFNSFGGFGEGGSVVQGSHQGPADDSAKNNYALWLPWEEAALVDWLFEPKNRRLFNVPRRKKECHELIIKQILPSKTSRAIEGKIRTLEKRYFKVLADVQDRNFAAKHPGKQPRSIAKALCASFDKLEAIFSPQMAPPQPHAGQDHHPAPLSWTGAAPLPEAATPTTSAVHAAAPDSGTLSMPRIPSPPGISATESMPLPHRVPTSGRKIAPKRGLEDSGTAEAADMDGPPTMNGGKRSRTLPSLMQNRLSPGLQPPQHYAHHLPQDQRSPVQLQHQRTYEATVRTPHEMYVRQTAPSLPTMPPKSPAAASSAAAATQAAAAAAAAVLQPQSLKHYPHHSHHRNPQPAAPSEVNIAGMRDPHDTAMTGPLIGAQGTREELEWLQFSLRREELEFRKQMFVREQDLETRRVRLEEQRLENQRRDADLESERLAVSRRQMDLQVESLKTMTTMLEHMVGHMAAAATAGSRPAGANPPLPQSHMAPAPDEPSAAAEPIIHVHPPEGPQ
ncbi:hypothetical protein H4R19_001040 [Coemansia spiralis]|nr:hypothetical protein H4R19_001040 [Coemansia spiralis]